MNLKKLANTTLLITAFAAAASAAAQSQIPAACNANDPLHIQSSILANPSGKKVLVIPKNSPNGEANGLPTRQGLLYDFGGDKICQGTVSINKAEKKLAHIEGSGPCISFDEAFRNNGGKCLPLGGMAAHLLPAYLDPIEDYKPVTKPKTP